ATLVASAEGAPLPPAAAQKPEPAQARSGRTKSKKTGDGNKEPVEHSPFANASRDFSAPDGAAAGATPPAAVTAPPPKEADKLAAAPTNGDEPPSRKAASEPEKKPASKKPVLAPEKDPRNDAAAIDEN